MRQDFAARGEASRQRHKASAATRVALRRALWGNCVMALKLNGDRLAVGFGGLEELAGGEAKHVSEYVCGKRLDLCIQVAHDGVVVAARILDRVFRLAQRALQLREFFR